MFISVKYQFIIDVLIFISVTYQFIIDVLMFVSVKYQFIIDVLMFFISKISVYYSCFKVCISKISVYYWCFNICISEISLYYPLANEVAKGYNKATVRPSVRPSFRNILVDTLESTSFNLTKLGTDLVLQKIWNPIDFQGHRLKVKVTGSNFYRVTSLWTL